MSAAVALVVALGVLALVLVAALILVFLGVLAVLVIVVHEDTSFSGCPMRVWCYYGCGLAKYSANLRKKDAKTC